MDIELAAKLFIEGGERMDKAATVLSRALPSQPIHKPVITTGIGNGGVITLIIPDNPAPGKMWFVSKVGVFGTDGHTTVAGIADIYGGPGEEATFPNQMYSGLSIPTIINEGRFHNPMQQNEQLYAMIYNSVNGQPYTFAAVVYEYNSPAVQAWEL